MSRTIVIGDVHGCLTELDELLKLLGKHPLDTLIFLGDFLDKGPDPIGTIRRVQELQEQRGEAIMVVQANHEERHVRWRRHTRAVAADPTYINPMSPPKDEDLRTHELLTDQDIEWFQSFPPYIRFRPNWVAVHAGLLHGVPLASQKVRDMIRLRWVRDGRAVASNYDDAGKGLEEPIPVNSAGEPAVHWVTLYDLPYNVVCGHESVSMKLPRVVPGKAPDTMVHSIDTSCVYGGRLTAFILHSNNKHEYVQVDAKAAYTESLFRLKEDK